MLNSTMLEPVFSSNSPLCLQSGTVGGQSVITPDFQGFTTLHGGSGVGCHHGNPPKEPNAAGWLAP